MSRTVVTGKQVCAMLGVCYRTVLRWRENHNLPMFKIGRRLFAYEDEIRAWFETHKYHLPPKD